MAMRMGLLGKKLGMTQVFAEDGERIPIPELMTHLRSAIEKFEDRDRVEWVYPDDLYLLGVKTEIEGICMNLVENALKYSTPGTRIQVEWSKNFLGEYVFTVTDQGPGIAPHEISRLTERYYRSPRYSADVPGSGLGLAIVQQAASKHDALLQIESKPGHFCQFSIVFPTYRCLREEPASASVFHISDH